VAEGEAWALVKNWGVKTADGNGTSWTTERRQRKRKKNKQRERKIEDRKKD